MESQLSSLVVALIGFVLTVGAVFGESQEFTSETDLNWVRAPVPAPVSVPGPAPVPGPDPAAPGPTPPRKRWTPPPTSVPPPRSVPPPPYRASPPPLPNERPRTRHRKLAPPPLPPRKAGLNSGMKIGLLFAGIALVLQVFVAAYLIYKRWQLF